MDSSPHLATEPEPETKKLRMTSTNTTTDEDDCIIPASATKQRYKRRKIAIVFAYCGVGYQGMQKNPGAKTIESDLEEALYLAGAVPESDRGNPKRYDWARSARTDKGVSAVGQIVSGRFYIDPPGLVQRLNSHLPPQIRIFGFKRVTASFNAKKFCDRRRYLYLLPVFALDPHAHPDRESVLASRDSENELSKYLECSERGRKVEGLMGRKGIELEGTESNGDSISTSVEQIEDFDTKAKSLHPVFSKCCNGEESLHKNLFSYGDKEKERFNAILRNYVGTHNFHNFTTRTKPEDPSARRYIVSFNADKTINVDGIEFVKCEVVGQSFMLHQIRKMIGLAVAIMRNSAPESLMQTSFRKDIRINVPMAPEVGLYLDECFFTSYNQKWKDSHEEVSMAAYVDEAEEFKVKHIYSHIADTEHKDGVVALWLHSLNPRNYPDFQLIVDNENCNKEQSSLSDDKIETFSSKIDTLA